MSCIHGAAPVAAALGTVGRDGWDVLEMVTDDGGDGSTLTSDTRGWDQVLPIKLCVPQSTWHSTTQCMKERMEGGRQEEGRQEGWREIMKIRLRAEWVRKQQWEAPGVCPERQGFFLGRTITTGEIRGGYGSGPSEGETMKCLAFPTRAEIRQRASKPSLISERKGKRT